MSLETRLSGPSGAVLVVRVPAALDHESAGPLRSVVERETPNRDGAGVVLDLADCRLITSIGIAALLQVEELAIGMGGGMCLAGMSEDLRRFLAMLRLDQRFSAEATVEEAVDRVAG